MRSNRMRGALRNPHRKTEENRDREGARIESRKIPFVFPPSREEGKREREMGAPSAAAAQERQTDNSTLIFTYGTLKRGFPNHPLLHEMIRTGEAVFLGEYLTLEKYPLVCGPYNVPFLLNLPRSGHRVRGELYAVSLSSLARIDVLEGIATGHYERLPIAVARPTDGDPEKEMVRAEAYYAHRSYAEEMWRRSGEEGMAAYTQEAARGYVRRADRPQNKTFLEHIQIFLSSPSC